MVTPGPDKGSQLRGKAWHRGELLDVKEGWGLAGRACEIATGTQEERQKDGTVEARTGDTVRSGDRSVSRPRRTELQERGRRLESFRAGSGG